MKRLIIIGAFALGCTPSVISTTSSTIVPNTHFAKIEIPTSNTNSDKRLKIKRVEPISISEKNFKCLAKNIYYEAGVEDWHGKIAVAQVTLQRRNLGKWGKTMCDVVYAKHQFSWTLDKKKAHVIPNGPLWEASKKAARDFLNGYRIRGLIADHYHTDYIKKPKWAKKMKKQTKIGRHIFYTAYDHSRRTDAMNAK